MHFFSRFSMPLAGILTRSLPALMTCQSGMHQEKQTSHGHVFVSELPVLRFAFSLWFFLFPSFLLLVFSPLPDLANRAASAFFSRNV